MIFYSIYLSCWFFTTFDPIQRMVDEVFERLPENFFTNILWQLFSCQYCLTLWAAFLITGDVLMALVMSLVAQIHKKLIE